MDTPHSEQADRSLVMIVDDDAAVRSSLLFSLGIEGYAVRVYSDAEELLNAPELPSCSCLIIDQRLSGMSGLELLERLRARNILAPAILITTYPDEAVRRDARAAHVPIVEKPLMENTLLEHLRTAVGPGRHNGAAP